MSQQTTSAESGAFIPLAEAVNLVVGLPAKTRMFAGHPGWLLWGKAVRAKNADAFPVIHIEADPGVTAQSVLVHLLRFIEWAWNEGYYAPPRLLNEYRRRGELNEQFARAIRSREIELELAELKSATWSTGEGVLARDNKIAELENERAAIANGVNGRPAERNKQASCLTVDDCLPNPPRSRDDWFHAIRETVREFIRANNRLPERGEAWAALCANPPRNSGIGPHPTRQNTLVLFGEINDDLSKASFRKRWDRWTGKTK